MSAALLIAFVIGSLLSAGAATAGTVANYEAQKKANQTNIDLAHESNEIIRQNNEAQLDLAKNAHQYEMEDLKKAGLNPILTATGGNGAPMTSLSSPQRPVVGAPQLDFSGVANAINSISHMMLISKMTESRNDTLIHNNESRNQVLNNLYKRKGDRLGYYEQSKGAVSSAHQISRAANTMKKVLKGRDIKKLSWDELLDDLDRM